MSNRAYLILYGAFCAFITAVAFMDLSLPRMFVIPPLHDRPGEILIVQHGLRELGYLDSAEAYCERCGMMWDLCRRELAAHVQNQTVYARLPYFQPLLGMSGATAEKWQSVPDQAEIAPPDSI